MEDTTLLNVENDIGDKNKPVVKPEIDYLPEQRRFLRLAFTSVLSTIFIGFLALMYFTEGILWRLPTPFRGLFYVSTILIIGLCIVLPALLTLIYMISGWIKILPPNIVYTVLAPFAQPKVKGPGTFLLFWPIERADVEVRKKQFPLPIKNVVTTSAEGWTIIVNGALEYIVDDPIKAAYNPGDLELSLTLLAERIIFDTASTVEYEYLRKNKVELSAEMLEKIQESLTAGLDYGIKIVSFALVDAELATQDAVKDYQEEVSAKKRAKSFEIMFASVKSQMPEATPKQISDVVAKLQIAANIGSGTSVLVGMQDSI